MSVRSYKIRNERIRGTTKVGAIVRKPRKEYVVELVWECDEKTGARRGKEGDVNECTGKKEDRNAKEKGLSADDVCDRATWRVCHPKSGNKMKEMKKLPVIQ